MDAQGEREVMSPNSKKYLNDALLALRVGSAPTWKELMQMSAEEQAAYLKAAEIIENEHFSKLALVFGNFDMYVALTGDKEVFGTLNAFRQHISLNRGNYATE